MNRRHLLILLLRPILLLLLMGGIIEGILRFSPYGRNFVLFSQKEGTDLTELNLTRHQPDHVYSIPFKKIKEKGCIRIFVAGEPVDTSFPRNPDITYSHILNRFLQQAYPGRKIELISIPPGSQEYLTQFWAIRQLKNFDADLVLIWPEWNTPGSRRTYSGLRLEKLINEMVNAHSRETSPGESERSMIHFEKDLDETISFLQQKNIPVIVFNPCVNLDFPPMKSKFTAPDSIRLHRLFMQGKTAYLNHDDEKAFSCLAAVNQKDGFHAGTCYYLGKLALKYKNPKEACRLLRSAADNDQERSRPPSVVRAIIARQSAIHNIPCIDTDQVFQRSSSDGIPGKNLFSGPRQPNLSGNILIARECFNSLLKGNYLKENPQSKPDELTLTPFDTAYDRLCSREGLQEFSEELLLPASGILPFEEKMLNLFVTRKMSWEDSMNQLYDYYIRNRKYDLAFRVIENLALENPYDISVNNQASIAASFLGDSQKVVRYAGRAFAMKHENELARRLLIHYLKLDRPSDALPYLEYARLKDRSLDLIYRATLQIIDLKKQLEHDSANPELRRQIATRYEAMGNNELALRYGHSR